jgi:pimeloyl-ACP methyl ester carboxylesterase
MPSADAPPVVLVHGWAGSFESTWQRSGFTALLDDAGRQVIGVDLLGHGTAPKPHDPHAYADLTTRITEALPDQPVDAIGFSLGALTLLRLATQFPQRLRRLVLAGVGRNAFDADEEQGQRMIAAVEGTADEADTAARAFASYAHEPGNDPQALAAVLRAGGRRLTPAEVATVTCPTLVVIGEHDFIGPADVLADALPNGTLQVLRNVDHFATPEAFGFIDAALEFIGAVPA